MAGPLIFEARDAEIARLRRRIDALEKKLESLETMRADFAWLSKEVRDIDFVQNESMDIDARNNRDLFERLSAVEAKVFPNLEDDLRDLRRVVRPDNSKPYNKLDRRRPKQKS